MVFFFINETPGTFLKELNQLYYSLKCQKAVSVDRKGLIVNNCSNLDSSLIQKSHISRSSIKGDKRTMLPTLCANNGLLLVLKADSHVLYA